MLCVLWLLDSARARTMSTVSSAEREEADETSQPEDSLIITVSGESPRQSEFDASHAIVVRSRSPNLISIFKKVENAMSSV